MKSLNRFLLAISVFTIFASNHLVAQEWSAKQLEVWKNVQTYWDLDAKRDLDGFMSYFDEDYSGWFNMDPLPGTKAEARKSLNYDFANNKILLQEIKPVAIKVHDNIAIVHYYYSRLVQNKEGKESMRRGNWTDILMKQGNKWVLIGDHGGPAPGED